VPGGEEAPLPSALRNPERGPRAPHKMFNSDFFHAPSHAHALYSGAGRRTVGHSLAARPVRPGQDASEADQAEQPVQLHLPNEDTFDVMREYFTASGSEQAERFGLMYSKDASEVPSVSDPDHPLHTHPKFHYQWLVHVKSPVTAQVVEEVERMIAPYKLQHFLPHNSYLVSLPYAMALKLRNGVSTADHDHAPEDGETATTKRGPVLFICMYHPSMKVQQDLPSLLADRWDRKMSTRANGPKHNPFAEPKRSMAHELRMTFTHPTLDSSAAHADLFPSHRKDMSLVEAYAEKQEKYWNNHPAFLDAMQRSGASKGGIEFHPVDATQIVVRLPAQLDFAVADSFLDPCRSVLASSRLIIFGY
jgi:hypothetical protein